VFHASKLRRRGHTFAQPAAWSRGRWARPSATRRAEIQKGHIGQLQGTSFVLGYYFVLCTQSTYSPPPGLKGSAYVLGIGADMNPGC
jgi:hypothetical protein